MRCPGNKGYANTYTTPLSPSEKGASKRSDASGVCPSGRAVVISPLPSVGEG